MSSSHSFTLTLSNNITEKEGVRFLLDKQTGFFQINLETKKELLDIFKIDRRYLQSFDLIYIPKMVGKKVSSDFIKTNLEDIIFIELKTTKKYLPDNPKGFFFGATENEFNFGRLLKNKFLFCFVTLNEKAPSFVLLSIKELEKIIKNKRIQYQINL
jgi:hypothetical protein